MVLNLREKSQLWKCEINVYKSQIHRHDTKCTRAVTITIECSQKSDTCNFSRHNHEFRTVFGTEVGKTNSDASEKCRVATCPLSAKRFLFTNVFMTLAEQIYGPPLKFFRWVGGGLLQHRAVYGRARACTTRNPRRTYGDSAHCG